MELSRRHYQRADRAAAATEKYGTAATALLERRRSHNQTSRPTEPLGSTAVTGVDSVQPVGERTDVSIPHRGSSPDRRRDAMLNNSRCRSSRPCSSLGSKRYVEKRLALRQSTPPWGVLLDHRHHGKLVNLSRTGLAVETRQAPSSFGRASLKVHREEGDALQLDASVIWCRMVGVDVLSQGESAPRFLVGLSCGDEELLELGAPRGLM